MAAEESSNGNSSIPKLPLFSALKLKYSPHQHSGILTPPLHSTTLVSVPFKWEEQPGKPRPCTDLILSIFNDQHPKSLNPPPARLYYLESTKVPSPTAVLDEPCSNLERGQLGNLVLYKNDKVRSRRGYWWQRFVKRRRVGGGGIRKENGVGGGSFVFSSTSVTDSSVKMARLGRNGSFTSPSHDRSHIWPLKEGLKLFSQQKSTPSRQYSCS